MGHREIWRIFPMRELARAEDLLGSVVESLAWNEGVDGGCDVVDRLWLRLKDGRTVVLIVSGEGGLTDRPEPL